MQQLYEGGPGEQVGLRKGDVVKAVDGADVQTKKLQILFAMVVSLMRKLP